MAVCYMLHMTDQ